MRPEVFRVQANGADASAGRVVWAPTKSLWIGLLIVCAVIFAPSAAGVGPAFVFLVSTYLTLLLGHSVGLHRRLIHKTFDCPKWLERFLVYLGVVVGMAGPFGILKIHDVRDWAQREPRCHDFFAHRRSLWLDAFWQLTCRFEFDRAPAFSIEPEIYSDRWYQWLERTWMLQQLPIAAALFAIGGWPWVVWGVFVRVPDAGVQASNLTGYGFLTMGECWHNNHHAFPESARIGLHAGEMDPGWWVILSLQKLGLVTRVGLPRAHSQREDLVHAN